MNREITGSLCRLLENLGFSEGLALQLAANEANGQIGPPRNCPAILEDEEGCIRGSHPIRGQKNRVRDCRLNLYRSERKRLAAQLSLCGYPEHEDEIQVPIGPALWSSIDPKRKVQNLREELKRASEYKRRGWQSAGHLALIGDTGTVKSHIIFALYFSALWDGISGWYLTMGDLRQASKELDSHSERVAHDAEYRVRGWRKRKLLVFDDLGDRLTDQRMSREPGSTKAAALLLDILNGHSGKRMFAANLDSDALAEHPDVGARAVSRLFGDHRVECKDKKVDIQACVILSLYGEDQRQYLLSQSEQS